MEFLHQQNQVPRLTRAKVKLLEDKITLKSEKSVSSISTLPSQNFIEDSIFQSGNSPFDSRSTSATSVGDQTLTASSQDLEMDINPTCTLSQSQTMTRQQYKQQYQQNSSQKSQNSQKNLSFSDLFKNSSSQNQQQQKAICNFRELPLLQQQRSTNLLMQSKKIQKNQNQHQNNQKFYLKPQYKQQLIKKYFATVPRQRFAEDYAIIKLQDHKKKKHTKYFCFNERELFIPQKYRQINLPCYVSDNDKESDEDTINNAVSFVADSLQQAIQKEKKSRLVHFCDLTDEEQ